MKLPKVLGISAILSASWLNAAMLNIDNSSFANAGLQLFGVNDPIFIERFPPQQNGATPSSLGISAPYTCLLYTSRCV